MKDYYKVVDEFINGDKETKKRMAAKFFKAIAVKMAILFVVITAAIIVLRIIKAMIAHIVMIVFAAGFLFYVVTPQGIIDRIIEHISDSWQRSRQIPCIYPVYIGYQNGRVMPDNINKEFEKIRNLFQVCYLVRCRDTGNRVVYSFKTISKPDTPVDYNLLKVIQGMGEQIMSDRLMDCAITAPINNMVAVAMEENILQISFAKNKDGLDETISCQDDLYRRYHQVGNSDLKDFKEDWDDEQRA